MARTMLHESKLPRCFWSYAWSTAGYIHNRLPNSRLKDKSPVELFYGVIPNPNIVYPFGAKALIHIPEERRKKLDERAQDAVMLGYPEAGAGWLFYSPREQRQQHSLIFKICQ
jgi:hypothetical protein